MIIPPGHIVRSGYVPTGEIVFPLDGSTMALASVEAKIRDYTGNPGREFYPLPVGSWEDGRFRLWDGRHRYIAALMLGVPRMLVCWTEPAGE